MLMKKEFYSFEDWCKDNEHDDYLDLWDYKLNDKKPCEISYRAKGKYWFKCPRYIHKSEAKAMYHVTDGGRRLFCNQCNSFGQWCQDNNKKELLDLWDYDLNDCSPYEVSYASKKKYWFKCQQGLHKSELIIIKSLTIGGKVLYCSHCCSFGQYLLDTFGENGVNLYWSGKNDISPFDIKKHSGKIKIYIKCQNKNHPDYLVTPYGFVNGSRCPVCANLKIIQGINDIYTTNPKMANLFLYQNEATKYAEHSNKYTYFKCPYCGNIIYSKINNISNFGLSCKKCGDGISYPEKFVFNVLQQISNFHKENIQLQNFETQKTFDWSKNVPHKNPKLSGDKKYDFYIPLADEILIETNGEQHFKECLFHTYKNSKTLEEEKENDELKMDIAISNGILPQNYIQLDCRYSNIDYIKESIMYSNLPKLLNFTESDIDWNECNRLATSSRVYEACELWNGGFHITKDIANKMKLTQTTIRNYLRRGFELGILQDPPKYLLKNNNTKLICGLS